MGNEDEVFTLAIKALLTALDDNDELDNVFVMLIRQHYSPLDIYPDLDIT